MPVRLRMLKATDSDRVFAWRNSDAVAPFMYTDHAIAPEEHARWLDQVMAAEDRRYWIIELGEAPVGLANVVRIDRGNARCEWAYYLGEPSTRGQGVGACVEYLVIRYVFERLGLNKLWCEVLVENEAVWNLHESFGFKREAYLRDHVHKSGRFCDVIGLGMLRRDWDEVKAAAEARLRAKGRDPDTLVIAED